MPRQSPGSRSVSMTCRTTENIPSRFSDFELWIRVLTRSRGWKRIVVQVPENEPAKKALNTGLASKSILLPLFNCEALKLKLFQVVSLFFSIRQFVSKSWVVEEIIEAVTNGNLVGRDERGREQNDGEDLQRIKRSSSLNKSWSRKITH